MNPSARRREQPRRGGKHRKKWEIAVVTFQASKIKEGRVSFAIAIVHPNVLSDEAAPDEMIAEYQGTVFRGIPVVLMARDARGIPTYYGRADIVRSLARVDLGKIPWMEYTVR